MAPIVLFLEWESYCNEYMFVIFENFGFQVEKMYLPRLEEDMRMGNEITEKIAMEIVRLQPDFVFSFNYFPVAAIACKATNVRYVSWTYDSPWRMSYSQTILYETNYIFIFDSEEVNRLLELGAPNVYYLPMPSATHVYDKMIPNYKHIQSYSSDVTFIGSLYTEKKNDMYRFLTNLDDYAKGYIEGLMELQKRLYGIDVIESGLRYAPKVVDRMRRVAQIEASGDGFETLEWTFANYFLARKVTSMERCEIMQLLSDEVMKQRERKEEKPWEIRLFTGEENNNYPGVIWGNKIDYYKHMPYAMKCAKINLNISLRSIHTGMPLRVMDILACGGFLLTNYQADLDMFLVSGEDYVYYDSIEDIPNMIRYYLEHEEERKQIADSGYNKAKRFFSYDSLVGQLLETMGYELA